MMRKKDLLQLAQFLKRIQRNTSQKLKLIKWTSIVMKVKNKFLIKVTQKIKDAIYANGI